MKNDEQLVIDGLVYDANPKDLTTGIKHLDDSSLISGVPGKTPEGLRYIGWSWDSEYKSSGGIIYGGDGNTTLRLYEDGDTVVRMAKVRNSQNLATLMFNVDYILYDSSGECLVLPDCTYMISTSVRGVGFKQTKRNNIKTENISLIKLWWDRFDVSRARAKRVIRISN